MKNRRYVISAFHAIAMLCLSCASAGKPAEKAEEPASFLPMSTGWYLYNSERTYKAIEDEFTFTKSMGMKMVSEITYKYTGVVCRFEDGVLFDPLTNMELLIDEDGFISCDQNISIKGNLNSDGHFFWGGLKEEHGRLTSIFVRGTIIPLPASARGGREYDGVYHMKDTGTDREQLVNISGGFYTWKYLDTNEYEEEMGFTPWPTLIRPDGSFSFGIDITTVMEMGEFSKVNYSSGDIFEGKVIPGQGITVEESSRTSGLGYDQEGAPQVYGGTYIRSGEFPNEAIPADIESLVKSGRAAVRAEPKPNLADYPSWYLKPPKKPGFIYAAGEKTFAVKETAFAMAEAAAAANLSEQLWVRIESSVLDTSHGNETLVDERIKSETMQRMNYRVIERTYNEKTHTAFVLAETALD